MSKEKDFAKKWKKEVGPANTNPNSIWEQLEAIEQAYTRPEGCFTTKEYAQQRQISADMALKRLSRLADVGKLEKLKIPTRGLFWRIK